MKNRKLVLIAGFVLLVALVVGFCFFKEGRWEWPLITA